MFDPRLLVGYDSSDDACVYSVSDDVAVIETVDFFTPIVDDPYLFGQIAAANALSDVYAMGGVPKLAMNLLCVPSCLPLDTVRAILEGGHDRAVEAGCVIAGGHTIQDDEPKYGLCVTGFVHPQHILKNIGAQPGDVLVLTKALGVGVITTALKAALADDSARDAAYASMAALNAKAAQAVREVENVHACTDVTGFGLLGHSYEMASGSGVTVRLHGAALPLLPQAEELADMGIVPGGACSTAHSARGSTWPPTRRPRADCSCRFPARTRRSCSKSSTPSRRGAPSSARCCRRARALWNLTERKKRRKPRLSSLFSHKSCFLCFFASRSSRNSFGSASASALARRSKTSLGLAVISPAAVSASLVSSGPTSS